MSIMIQKRLFNVEEYYKMGEVGILAENDRTELINGEIIIKMSPINRPHAYIIDVLMEILVIDLRFRAHVSVQSPIYLSEYSMPQPDLYIAKYQKDKYRNGHPTAEDILLIVEVSDSTLKFDQTVKQKLYAKAGIPEYL
ncbi:MAG: Uma2 family endonuclease [Bacteroidota bacterium]